ncbi:DUF5067 domain-containing protein [Salinicoccus carnicancri]|uniref:DUF5067 domain-containing protein n=1 Tax=Salinicoccus carnicancri TaxID=558170 RepID=UPI0002FB6EDF|nr:DUF5067 domain-containing protein [Salinicoccus carnicancri]
MSMKKYLLSGVLSTALLLGACGGADSGEEDASGDNTEESGTGEENQDVSYSGQYGDFNVVEFSQTTMEAPEEEAEGEEETGPTEAVVIEFEFTNNSDVATSPQEAFGLDLAVRQMDGDSETPLENLTMDLPEDFEKSDEADAAAEMIEPGESSTAVVAYGPLDPELETVLQSRENPMAEEDSDPLDYTIELEESGEKE